jgi:hypothetical protein
MPAIDTRCSKLNDDSAFSDDHIIPSPARLTWSHGSGAVCASPSEGRASSGTLEDKGLTCNVGHSSVDELVNHPRLLYELL